MGWNLTWPNTCKMSTKARDLKKKCLADRFPTGKKCCGYSIQFQKIGALKDGKDFKNDSRHESINHASNLQADNRKQSWDMKGIKGAGDSVAEILLQHVAALFPPQIHATHGIVAHPAQLQPIGLMVF